MIPLLIFLVACAGVYLGAIEAAFSALMRLSLRLAAERSDRPDRLGAYLDDPILLFVPVRLLLGLVTSMATALMAEVVGLDGAHRVALVVAAVIAFVVVFELLLPLAIVSRDPERALEVLLPSFSPIAQALGPLARWSVRSVPTKKTAGGDAPGEDGEDGEADEATKEYEAEQEGLIEGEERRLLQSIVDFGDTLVREVMTPRPDIVAIPDTASIGELRLRFREQEYSRFPVFKDSLDNIAGFVFVKDLVALDHPDDSRPITPFLRPAVVVPESKRVPELLKQFQRQQTQCAIVVDEYGGTAGLVTIEDLLEEIVGEIRDEYDVESEPIVDEGGGRFVFSGKVNIDEVIQRLNVEIEREGFETVGGYLLSHLGRVPAVGERFEMDGLTVEVLDAERRRINKVRICRKLSTTEDMEDAEAKPDRSHEIRVCLVHRPPERRQVDAAQPARRHQARHRLRQAADDEEPDSRRAELFRTRRWCSSTRRASTGRLHRMNVRMVDAAVDTIREVDVLGLVVDVTEPTGKGDRFVLDLVKRAKAPVFLILNKIDLIKKVKLLPIMQQYSELASFAEIVPVSAGTGDNVDRLERLIIDRLPEGEALYPPDYLTDQPERFFAAEIVREKLLQFTHAEIPFSSAVVIDRFEEPEGKKGILKLYCTIVVERESQKPIVVGRGGDMIKRIGIAAREDLEKFFDTKVFLDLHVRVKSEWREDVGVLNDIGVK